MLHAGYLDHNATTPIRPQAAAAVAEALARVGNPSSVHRFGRDARRFIEVARESVAVLVGAHPSQVLFTSGGTEANNLALRGFRGEMMHVSAIEHDSVLSAVPGLVTMPVNGDGVVDLDAFEALVSRGGNPALVSVMLANNETGVIQPVAAVARVAHRCGAVVHCDAVQAVGKIAVNVNALGADMMTLSAHKIGGPTGVGALVVSDRVHLESLLRGGGQERGRRAGTENVAGIAGFGAAAVAARGEGLADGMRLMELRERMERGILDAAPKARIFGASVERLPNTTCVEMPSVSSEVQVMALDLEGIAVSAGSACSSGKVRASHVLAAMGAGGAASHAIRVSLGWTTTDADIERFLEAWSGLYRRIGSKRASVVTAA